MTFKDKWLTEWRRLNPKYARPDDNLRQVFGHAFQEGLPAYFAPLRMLWWLLLRSWRS
jgi:hypothetical protein